MKPLNYLDLPFFYNDKLIYRKTNIPLNLYKKPNVIQKLPAYLFNQKKEQKERDVEACKEIDISDSKNIRRVPTMPRPIPKSRERIENTMQRLAFLTNKIDLTKIFRTNINTPMNEKQRIADTTFSSMRRIPLPDQEDEKRSLREEEGNQICHIVPPQHKGTRILLKRIKKERKTKRKQEKNKLRKYRFLRKKIKKIREFWIGETRKIPFIFRIFDSNEEQTDTREEVIELSGKLVQPKLFLNSK